MATITIRVDDDTATTSLDVGGADVSVGAGVSADSAPAPTLVEMPEATTSAAAESGEGPPPMDLADLGISAGATAAEEGTGPAPPDDIVEGGESDDAEAPAPMPVKDLEGSKAKTTKSSRAKS